MYSPLSVTITPKGSPWRNLKFEIACRALVITGFWPVIISNCLTIIGIIFSLAFGSAGSVIPIFKTIFSIFGTANRLGLANSFFRAGTTFS